MTIVTVTSAIELTKPQLKRIHDAVVAKHGKNVELEQQIDPDVIGGIRLTVGSRQVDATIKQKLYQLKNQLLSI